MKTKTITDRTGLTRAGVKYKRDRGETDAEIVRGQGVSDASGETMAAAQLRKEKALANLRELEVAQKSGALIPLDHAILAGANMAQMTRQRMTTIPSTLAGALAATSDEREVRAILDAEITRQLVHLSTDFLAAGNDGIEEGGQPDEPAEADEPIEESSTGSKPKSKPQPATGGNPKKGKS